MLAYGGRGLYDTDSEDDDEGKPVRAASEDVRTAGSSDLARSYLSREGCRALGVGW